MPEHVHHTMDQQIFNLGLSVEATSAYIVVTSLLGDQIRTALEEIRGRWTISHEELDRALEELVAHNVLEVRRGGDGMDFYFPQPSSLWR